jgi:tetratricopeptide (TPR) repeat protein
MEKTRVKQDFLIYVGLVVLTVFAFEKVRKCEFVYNDRAYVQENEYIKAESAVKQYYRILEIKPDHIEAFNNLAWIFATTEDESLSNPAEAIKLAEKACALSKRKNARLLDTLAAAYASSSRFKEAVETAEKAIKLAEDANEENLAEEIQERLNLYKSDQPYRHK